MPGAGQTIKSTLEFVERASGVLRTAPAGALALYYVGSLPFILGFLYFQGEMSRNPFAAGYCTAASLALGLGFIWMKCWQAVFLLNIQARLNHRSPPDWSVRKVVRLVALQVIIQPSGLFLLPLALATVMPFGWVYAFYQSALTCGWRSPIRIRRVIAGAWHQAAWQPVQNHLLLAVYFLFGLFVMLNVGAGLILIPMALKTFLDIDTRFSMSALSMLNTTFLFTTAALTYLCLDPLLKISYALRGFYGGALRTGADLRADLKECRRHLKILAAAALLVVCLTSDGGLHAADGPEAAAAPRLTAAVLDEAIDTVMTRREFTWRMPRSETRAETGDPGFFKAGLDWLAEQLEAVAQAFDYVEKLIRWLKKHLPEFDFDNDSPDAGGLALAPQALLVFFVVLLVCFLAVWFLKRVIVRRPPADPEPTDAPRARPDLSNEDVRADQLPADQWFSMAEELAAKGEYRLALRALYLCSLSQLGEARLISIARHKSNLDYHRELVRRAHARSELLDLFQQNLRFFEKTWYGRHAVNRADVGRFQKRHERMVACAQ